MERGGGEPTVVGFDFGALFTVCSAVCRSSCIVLEPRRNKYTRALVSVCMASLSHVIYRWRLSAAGVTCEGPLGRWGVFERAPTRRFVMAGVLHEITISRPSSERGLFRLPISTCFFAAFCHFPHTPKTDMRQNGSLHRQEIHRPSVQHGSETRTRDSSSETPTDNTARAKMTAKLSEIQSHQLMERQQQERVA